ncbi:MAG: Ig-like domain-containing protein [Bacteroidetes bacterium]|nr:Ig-like domain-containing protein [Bacteroidota bacterium]
MKKTSLLFAIASIVLITLPSCKKTEQEELPVTETIHATVKLNETYSYILPMNEGHIPYTIAKQGEHDNISVIEKSADGSFVYKYTPTANFTGSDMVIISNEKEGHGNCEHQDHDSDHGERRHNRRGHHGNGEHHEHEMQKHIITINFTIANKVANKASANDK